MSDFHQMRRSEVAAKCWTFTAGRCTAVAEGDSSRGEIRHRELRMGFLPTLNRVRTAAIPSWPGFVPAIHVGPPHCGFSYGWRPIDETFESRAS
jgi:hypothetical protein